MHKTLRQLGPTDAGMRLSRSAFADAVLEEPFIYERVAGRLVVMSPSGPQHRRLTRVFSRALHVYWDEHPDIVDFVDQEGWVITEDATDRLPDICVYLAGPQSGKDVPGRVPELSYEFVSENRADQERDYIDKRGEYHAIGVKEYVIVDRFKQAALVLTWAEGDYEEQWLTPEQTHSTKLLPGLKVELSEVFKEGGETQ